jgi:hypothetical protein
MALVQQKLQCRRHSLNASVGYLADEGRPLIRLLLRTAKEFLVAVAPVNGKARCC